MTNATVPPVSTFTGDFTATPVTSGEVTKDASICFFACFSRSYRTVSTCALSTPIRSVTLFFFKNPSVDESIVV